MAIKIFSFFGSAREEKAARKRAESLHGLPVRYVTERVDGNDDVVSHGGHIAVADGEFIIDSDKDTLFRCSLDDVKTAMLMSGDGVIISGPNTLENGKQRCYTVHFVYHRK